MNQSIIECMKVILATLILCFSINSTLAQTTAFTYQGKLSENGNPPNGNYDFEFKLSTNNKHKSKNKSSNSPNSRGSCNNSNNKIRRNKYNFSNNSARLRG